MPETPTQTHQDPQGTLPANIRLPTLLAAKFVRYTVGFGVAVAVGLAPFLGKVGVPGFKALILMIPDSLHGNIFPLSAFIMGTLAVWIQWQAGEEPTRQWQNQSFRRFLVLTFVSIGAFIIVQAFVVVTIHGAGMDKPISFLIGFNTPAPHPPCSDLREPNECVKRLVTESRISEYWGHRQIAVARLALVISYLLSTAAFATLIGLLIIREACRREAGRSVRAEKLETGATRWSSEHKDGPTRDPLALPFTGTIPPPAP